MKSTVCFNKHNEPRTVYSAEYEAMQGAERCLYRYGKKFVPYQCDRCQLWHLSPIERETFSHKCSYCVDSHGKPKATYRNETEAMLRAEIIKKENGVAFLRAYSCPHGDGWHLTKSW